MGIDLTLLPLDCWFPPGEVQANGTIREKGWGYSHTILNLPRNYPCWDAINKLNMLPLDGADISSYIGARIEDGSHQGERTYGSLSTDPYGDEIRLVKAGDLAPVLMKHLSNHPASAYVAAMRPDCLVALYWH